MAFPTKLAVAGIAGTGLVGSGVGAIYLLQNNQEVKEVTSIEQQLSKEKKTLIKGTDKSALWTIKFSTYDKEVKNKDFANGLSFSNGEGIKTWCESKIAIDFSNENQNTYKAVKELCVVPTNREKVVLKDAKEKTKDGSWATKLESYKRDATGELLITGISKESETDHNKIKNWCETELNKEYENDSQANYKAMVKWCTEKGV